MTDEEASAHAAHIYDALQIVESRNPDSRAVAVLHERLYRALEDLIVERPGIVRPFDGTNKPPPGP
jgi:hypothetical protein